MLYCEILDVCLCLLCHSQTSALIQVCVCGSHRSVLVASRNLLLLSPTDVDVLFCIWSVLWRKPTKAFCTFQEKQLEPRYLFDRLVSAAVTCPPRVLLARQPWLMSCAQGALCPVAPSQLSWLVVFRRKPHGQILQADVRFGGLHTVENSRFALITLSSLVPELV